MTMPFVVFDLDDTLYLERNFARSGYRAVDGWLRETQGVEGFAETCQDLFDSGERRHVFDRALARHGLNINVAALVDVYRGHSPDISLEPDADRAIERFGARSGLISDGPAETQRAKVRALGLERRLGVILLTGELGPDAGKPSPVAFRLMEQSSGASPPELVYVADNPQKDFITPRLRGWQTVMIARPGRVHTAPPPSRSHAAAHEIVSLDELERCLGEQDISSRSDCREGVTDVGHRFRCDPLLQ